MTRTILLLVVAALSTMAQTKSQSVVGTVTGFRPDSLEVVVKNDQGVETPVRISAETAIQRVAPGSTDLKSAQAIGVGEIKNGDRVLVNMATGGMVARRVVVMPATEIAKKNEEDKLDWQKRGVAGVVASKKSGQIEVKMRTMQGESVAKVVVTDSTRFRRYAPDSVKFSDAKDSGLAEVTSGDQLRARGKKSEDGLTVEAEEIVFGSFVTKAGTVTAIDVEHKRVTVKETGTDKPFVIQLVADSQVKSMPSFPGMSGGMRGNGGPGGARPEGDMGGRPAGMAGGPGGPGRPGGLSGPGGPGSPEGGRPQGGPGGGFGPRLGGGGDIAQMIERMPATTIDALKPGETVVVSSTKGAKQDEVTAIMLLANAEMLVRMATAQQQREGGRGGMAGGGMQGGGMGMGGMSGGLGGLELPGMLP